MESEVGGPEYETLWSFGSDCDVYDLDAVNEANMLCNEYGLIQFQLVQLLRLQWNYIKEDILKMKK